MTKYLISTDGYMNSLLSNSEGRYVYVEFDNDIRKIIKHWADENFHVVNMDSIEIDYLLERVSFRWDMEAIYEDGQFDFFAEWSLIKIDKP